MPRKSTRANRIAAALGITATAATGVIAVLDHLGANEGGHVNHPSDPGGETNHGITKRVAVKSGYKGDMRLLPKELAEDIYVTNYIQKPGFVPLVRLEWGVGAEAVDTGVNMGPRWPSCWLQRSLNALNRRGKDWSDIKVDCRVGPATVAAFEAFQSKRGKRDACKVIVRYLDAFQGVRYIELAERNPKLEDFTFGWGRTRLGNIDLSQCGASASAQP